MFQRSLLLAAVVMFSAAACSSSKTQPEQDLNELQGTESSADTVGSIPEDMLAAEETESGAPADAAAAKTATDAGAADPFADLKEKEPPAESLATIEGGDGDAAATTGQIEWYSVKAGDTLMKVAFTIYGDIDRWKDLFDWNRPTLKKASQLKVGMKLKYETPSQAFQPEQLGHSYTIKSGDTLANIADEVYGRKMKYRKLQNYNKRLIKNPNRIFAGFTIFYDITPKEMAEAEARRKEKAAMANVAPPITPIDTNVPSAIAPPAEVPLPPAPVAISPPAPGPSSVAPPPTGP